MKIAICGAQCTGKSTLISDLAEACPQLTQPTFTYRDAITEAGVEQNINRETNANSQRIIFNALAEEIKRAPDNTILDRCVMDAVVYTIWPTQFNAGKTDISLKMANNMHRTASELMGLYDLIVYIPVDDGIKLEDDKFRDIDPEFRRQIGKIFEELLFLDIDDPNFDKYGYKVVSISGTREERVESLKSYIKTISQ